MAKHMVNSTWGMARQVAVATAALGIIFLSVGVGVSQEEPIGPGRARDALQRGIEQHKAKNYETAAGYFAFAQQAESSLKPAEQQDLATFRTQNSAALKNQQEGAVQVKQAADALKQGKMQEAGALLKSLEVNPYLTTLDRQSLAELNRFVQSQAAGATTLPAKGDGKALLSAGRSALKDGDLAKAEMFAGQAEQANSGIQSWLQPWSDSPAKLRRDIQAAKAKAQPAPIQTAKAEPEAKGSSWLPSMPTWFSKSDKPAAPAKIDPEVSSERRVDAMVARQLIKDGYIFLQVGDLEKARMNALKVKQLNVTFGPDEQTADQLLHEIQRKLGGPAAVVAEAKPAELPPIEMPNSTDPRVLLKHGRTLLEKKYYEEADKLCGKIIATNTRWGLFEDTPEKLRRDIHRTKMFADRDEAPKVMAEARKLFTQGNLEEAERKAYKAQQMHGPYGVFDFGDRPTTLIDEIQRVKQAKGITTPTEKPDATQVAKDTPGKNPAPPVGVPAGIQAANKNRAIVMVREARELERQGQLTEARQKAYEARMLRATFSPEEDSPENLLLSLSAKCERQVQTMLQQAAEHVAVAADPQRFEKASRQLNAARNLAQTFELDLSRVEQTAALVQKAYTGGSPVSFASTVNPLTSGPANFDVSTGDPEKDRLRKIGREKLRDAQTELSHGKYAQARKMAEEIYDARYGLQEEVQRLLRSIGNEEYEQRCLATKRNFDAARDAYVQKEYRKAQYIFGSIDPMMLPLQDQAHLRDIMGTREMQPEQLMQVAHKEPIKGTLIRVTDPDTLPRDPDDEILADAMARELVQFQMLRQRGMEAQRTAHDLFKNKQREQALNTLQNYLDQVKMAQFEKEKISKLCLPVENKIQQYKQIIASDNLQNIEEGYRFPYGKSKEGENQTAKKKHQEEVYAMMKEANELTKQRRLKEALVIAKKVREIDPENQAGVALEMILTTRMEQQKWNDEEKANQSAFLGALPHKLFDPKVLDGDITFDKAILDRAQKRDSGAIRSQLQDPKERLIQYRLTQPLSLNFKNQPLREAIVDIGLQAGIPVHADLRALQDARINLDAPLTQQIEGTDMKSALNILLRPMKLTYIIEDQVLKITTEDRTAGKMVRVFYPVADLVVVPEDHPLPDVYNIQKMIERVVSPGMNLPNFAPTPAFLNNGGTPVSSHSQGLGGAFGSTPGHSPGMPMPVENKKQEMGNVLVQLIKNVISKDKWDDVGGPGHIEYTPFGLALVVNQVLDVQKDVEELLASLRRLQDLQVSVELRAVLVSESFFERIGVDFNMNILTPSTPGKAALAASNLPIASANKTFAGYTQAGSITPDLNIPVLNNTFNFTQPQFGGYQPGAGLSLGLAFLSEIQVFMFLEAVAGDQRAHVMQAPKLTVYNGQSAFITANVARPFMSGVTPVIAPNGYPVMIPQMTVYPLGLGMTVQPVVSPDRRFVRLNVTPILSSGFVDPAGQIIIPTPLFPANQIAPPFNTGQPQPPLPTNPLTVTNGLQFNPLVANVNVVNTTVNVPDGGTVLMGGFKFLAEQRSEYGPPVLSNIPYLSRLFRNVGWSRDSSTLLYLVTARIIMVEEEERMFLGLDPAIPRN